MNLLSLLETRAAERNEVRVVVGCRERPAKSVAYDAWLSVRTAIYEEPERFLRDERIPFLPPVPCSLCDARPRHGHGTENEARECQELRHKGAARRTALTVLPEFDPRAYLNAPNVFCLAYSIECEAVGVFPGPKWTEKKRPTSQRLDRLRNNPPPELLRRFSGWASGILEQRVAAARAEEIRQSRAQLVETARQILSAAGTELRELAPDLLSLLVRRAADERQRAMAISMASQPGISMANGTLYIDHRGGQRFVQPGQRVRRKELLGPYADPADHSLAAVEDDPYTDMAVLAGEKPYGKRRA